MLSELKLLQLERLQATLNRVYKEVPFYRKLFDKSSFDPEDFADIEDIKRVPFTTRQDLSENYPYNMFAVPLREIVRILATSGTTGDPLVVGYTQRDLERLSEISARALQNFGLTKEDVVQITFHPGLFSSAFGLQSGAERIGASVIPVHFKDPGKQLKIMQDYRTTVLICTPSYANWLAESLLERGINPNSLFLKKIIFCGEPFDEAHRRRIEDIFKVRIYNLYTITEIFGPGIAYECETERRLHFQEEFFLVEVLHPEDLHPVKPGEFGELVITTLSKEALPLIRYRTGDLVILKEEVCSCGQNLISTSPILGRRDDLLIIQGIKIDPTHIEKIIEELCGDSLVFQLQVLKGEGREEVYLLIALSEKLFSDSFTQQDLLRKRLEERLQLEFSLPIRVKFVEASSLEKRGEKLPKIIDKR